MTASRYCFQLSRTLRSNLGSREGRVPAPGLVAAVVSSRRLQVAAARSGSIRRTSSSARRGSSALRGPGPWQPGGLVDGAARTGTVPTRRARGRRGADRGRLNPAGSWTALRGPGPFQPGGLVQGVARTGAVPTRRAWEGGSRAFERLQRSRGLCAVALRRDRGAALAWGRSRRLCRGSVEP